MQNSYTRPSKKAINGNEEAKIWCQCEREVMKLNRTSSKLVRMKNSNVRQNDIKQSIKKFKREKAVFFFIKVGHKLKSTASTTDG